MNYGLYHGGHPPALYQRAWTEAIACGTFQLAPNETFNIQGLINPAQVPNTAGLVTMMVLRCFRNALVRTPRANGIYTQMNCMASIRLQNGEYRQINQHLLRSTLTFAFRNFSLPVGTLPPATAPLPGNIHRLNWPQMYLNLQPLIQGWVNHLLGPSTDSDTDFSQMEEAYLEVHFVHEQYRYGSCAQENKRVVIKHVFSVPPESILLGADPATGVDREIAPPLRQRAVTLVSIRSKDDNCGIQCVLHGFDALHFSIRAKCTFMTGNDLDKYKRPRSVNANLIRHQANIGVGPIHYQTGMDAITALTQIRITVVNLRMEILHQTTLPEDNNNPACHVVICLDDVGAYDMNSGEGHYFWVKSGEYMVRSKQVDSRRRLKPILCDRCHDFKVLGHKCDEERVKILSKGRPSEEKRDRAQANLPPSPTPPPPSPSSSPSSSSIRPSAAQLLEVEEYLSAMKKAYFDDGLHILLHGPGGSGKTWMIDALMRESESRGWSENELVKLAPTGVVAVANDAHTIHSWLGLKSSFLEGKTNSELFEHIMQNEVTVRKVRYARGLLLDEISMLSAKILSLLECVSRAARNNSDPMGGLQLIMMGDTLQLPTIKSLPFWRSPTWSRICNDLQIFNRTDTYGFRHSDREWATCLAHVRTCSMTPQDEQYLQTRNYSSVYEAINAITAEYGTKWFSIASLNRQRMMLNHAAMQGLPNSTKRTFKAIDRCTSGLRLNRFGYVPQRIDRRLPAGIDRELTLARGYPVMYCGNNALRKQYDIANGTMGEVRDWSSDGNTITVLWENGKELEIERCDFNVSQGDDVWTRSQFPLALASSRTVHKVQGMTLDIPLLIVLSNAFEVSQVYVALSRCRSFRKVFLVGYRSELIKCSAESLAFNRWCLARDGLHPVLLSNGNTAPSTFDWSTFSRAEEEDFSMDAMYQGHDHHRLSCKIIPGRHEKTVEQRRLSRKTIWYDLETFYDGVRELPYYNYLMEIWTNSQGDTILENSKEICSLCNHGTPEHIPPNKVMEVTVKWIMDRVIAERDRYLLAKSQSVTIAHLRHLQHPYTICAYNGAGFDFHFLLREMMLYLQSGNGMDRFILQPVMKGGYVVMLSLFDLESNSEAMTVHDICQFTMCSLSQAAKEYLNDSSLSKGTFPHRWVTNNYEYFLQCGDQSIRLTLDDFPPGSHRNAAADQVETGELDLTQYPIHRILHDYGRSDVVILRRLYECIDRLCLEEVGASVLNFHTISQYTWYGCVKHFPDEMTLRKLPEGVSQVTQHMKDAESYRTFNVYKLTRNLDRETRSCITGGKVLPRAYRWRSSDWGKPYNEIEDYYVYADIVSMYPWAMINCDYPLGQWVRHTEKKECDVFRRKWLEDYVLEDPFTTEKDTFPLCLMKVDLTLNPEDLEPPIPRQRDVEKPERGLKWDVGQRHTRWITSIDLWLAMSHGGTLHHVHEYITFATRGKPYKTWVQRCFDGKREAQRVGHTAKRQQCKLAANSTYGTTLKRDFDDVVIAVSDVKQLDRFHDDFDWLETINWRQVLETQGAPPTLLLKGQRHSNGDYDVTSKPRYHGAFTLSWTRLLLDRMLMDVNPEALSGSTAAIEKQVLYGDTDSFMFHVSALPRMRKWFGNECGQLNDDLADAASGCDFKLDKFVKVVDFASRCPKWYACRGIRPNDTTKDVVKMASINIKDSKFTFPDGHVQTSLRFDDFLFICDQHSGPNDEKITVSMEDRILRCGVKVPIARHGVGNTSYDLYRGSLHRTLFKTCWDGRQVYAHDNNNNNNNVNIWTVPCGWRARERENDVQDMSVMEEKKEEEKQE